MDQDHLHEVMIFHLRNLNRENVDVNLDTVLNSVLSTTDGYGNSNSRNIFRAMMGWTFKKAGIKNKKWPFNWMELSVKDLAAKILTIVMLFLSVTATAQLQVSIGAGKTDLRDNAINIGISYLKSFDSIWRNSDYLFAGRNSLFTVSPEASIVTGNQDAFSSITLKATGLLMTFKDTTVAAITTPNSARTFHTFPFSVGVETNNLFNSMNAIVEAGWVPWYQAETRRIPEWIKRTKFGFFLQAGYKFYLDSTGKNAYGGEIDQSHEEFRSTIFRAKGSFGVDTKSILKVNGLDIGLVGNADAWYDFINGEVYHRIDARGRFYVTPENYIDLIYQKGSGAPNFNQGDQFGVGLTVTF
jgi:hypothetical protein